MADDRRIVALVTDIMDRSRVSAALGSDVEFARSATAAAGADIVIIDLARFAAEVSAVRSAAPHATLIAFGPHVDDETLAAAHAAGSDLVMARSRFFRDVAAALESATGR